MFWTEILLIGAGFLLGSVLYSYHLPKLLRHVDTVKQSVDGNPGTANAFKYAGVPVGLLCLLMDMLKGALPVYIAIRLLGDRFLLLPVVMAAPVMGHALGLMYPFGGGKCIATVFGVLIGLMPGSQAGWILVFWYLFFSLVVVVHPNERRSVVTFLLFALCCTLAGTLVTHHVVKAMGCVTVALIAAQRNYASLKKMTKEQIALHAVEHAEN